jgi:hypothetical protein
VSPFPESPNPYVLSPLAFPLVSDSDRLWL